MFNHPILIQKLNELSDRYNPLIIGIDGPSASGKTTLANFLASKYGADVIHMDDFFLPANKQLPEQLQKPGGNIDFDRLHTEVIIPLQSKLAFEYNVFSCKTQTFTKQIRITDPHMIIIEGAYSHHPKIADLYQYKVYLNHDKKTQKNRITKRNGSQVLKTFESKWIPFEEKYFEHFQIEANASLIIDTKYLF